MYGDAKQWHMHGQVHDINTDFVVLHNIQRKIVITKKPQSRQDVTSFSPICVDDTVYIH